MFCSVLNEGRGPGRVQLSYSGSPLLAAFLEVVWITLYNYVLLIRVSNFEFTRKLLQILIVSKRRNAS